MKNILFFIMLFLFCIPVFSSENGCQSTIPGYHVVEKTVFQFVVDQKKLCFFAFYTKNPDPCVGVRGNGNAGESLWFGYYEIKKPAIVHEMPKPSDDDWSGMCSVNAVAFYDMNDDKIPDITVIGSCEKNAINYTFPFVFIRKGNEYILNEKLYRRLYSFIALTVADVGKYIKTKGGNYNELKTRYTLR